MDEGRLSVHSQLERDSMNDPVQEREVNADVLVHMVAGFVFTFITEK